MPALSLLFALALPSLAFAQGPDVAAPDAAPAAVAPTDAPETPAATPPDAEAEAPPAGYVEALTEAVAEYDAARYPEALALFERAHALYPNARTLRGIGMAAFESGRYVTALRALRQALTSTVRPLTPEQHEHVERLIGRTEVFVATLDVVASPPEAVILVDGGALVREPDGMVLLDQGHHTITATDPSGRSQSVEVDLVGGTTRSVRVQIDSLAGGVAPTTVVGVSLLVAGGLATVAAVATALVTQDLEGQLRTGCDGFVCPGELRATRDRANELAIVTDVIGSAAAVLMATGMVLTIVGTTAASPSSVSVACGPAGCSVGGTF